MKTHDFLTKIQKGSEPTPIKIYRIQFRLLFLAIYTFFKPAK